MINLVEKSRNQPPGKATSTMSSMLQSMCEVHRSNVSGDLGSGFFPSRPPWPLSPCQMPFLHLLDFQSAKSLRPDAPGGEIGTKISLGSCSATSSRSPQRHNSVLPSAFLLCSLLAQCKYLSAAEICHLWSWSR